MSRAPGSGISGSPPLWGAQRGTAEQGAGACGPARACELADQRISNRDVQATEITVCSPQFVHAMEATERGDSRVVNGRASDLCATEQLLQARPVVTLLAEQHQAGALQPGSDLIQRL